MDCAPEWAPGRESSLRSAGWASKGSGEALHLAVGRHVRARKLPLELVWIKNHPDDGSTSVYCSTDEKCRLAFPVALRIQLRGGLKLRGNQYFIFALPCVEVIGSTDRTDIYCNDHLLSADVDTGLYVIPDTLKARKLVIEARQNGERVRRRTLYAVEGYDGPESIPVIRLDRFGFGGDDSKSETCVGPIISGFTPPDFNPETFLPPGAGHRVYLVGRNPGEIVECPNETIADDWKPIWAVWMTKRRKGTAIYCGTDLENDVPGTAKCTDRRRLRFWKEVLWYKRKQISGPSHKRIRALWIVFREIAHRVH